MLNRGSRFGVSTGEDSKVSAIFTLAMAKANLYISWKTIIHYEGPVSLFYLDSLIDSSGDFLTVERSISHTHYIQYRILSSMNETKVTLWPAVLVKQAKLSSVKWLGGEYAFLHEIS